MGKQQALRAAPKVTPDEEEAARAASVNLSVLMLYWQTCIRPSSPLNMLPGVQARALRAL